MALRTSVKSQYFPEFVNVWRYMPTKWLQERLNGSKNGSGITSLENPPDLDPFFDDLTRAKSAKELNVHLKTRVL